MKKTARFRTVYHNTIQALPAFCKGDQVFIKRIHPTTTKAATQEAEWQPVPFKWVDPLP